MVAGAADRVEGYVRLDAPAKLAAVEGELAALDAPGRRRTSARAARQRLLRRARGALIGRGVAAWGWKLITIAPQWSPAAAYSYSVEGLRARLDDVRARWRALWDSGLAVEGLAAAYARVEISMGGHVHLHVLYFGPFLVQPWAQATAGCHVDVRAVKGDEVKRATREAVKYTLKSASPLRGAWVGGAHYRTPHPELAAAWVLATRHRRTVEAYGTFRAAVHAELNTTTDDEKARESLRGCASCGSDDLSEPRTERVEELARRLGVNGWRWRPTAAGAVAAACGRATLPARIGVVRV